MRWRRRRPLVIFAVAVLAIGLAPFAINYWYFREVEHHRVASPDDRWVAVVTKRMKQFPEPVEVRLKVIESHGSGPDWIDIDLDSPDVWEDVKPGSYRVEWVSDAEFRVGPRDPDGEAEYRVRLVGERWVVGW